MHKPHKNLYRFGKYHHGHYRKAPSVLKLINIHSHTPKTHGFLFSSQRISKNLILCCDNYPCCSPMAHLHNHHQPFTEDTQRIIMRQQRNKKPFREPLKTCTESAVIVALTLHIERHQTGRERCPGHLFRKRKLQNALASVSPNIHVAKLGVLRLLRCCIFGELVER